MIEIEVKNNKQKQKELSPADLFGSDYGPIYECYDSRNGYKYENYYFSFGPNNNVGMLYKIGEKWNISSSNLNNLKGLSSWIKVRPIKAKLKISLEIE